MLAEIVDVHRRTRKPTDILWNRLVARPLAAVVLAPLARTNVTPNQVTLATLGVFIASAIVMATRLGHRGLVLAVVLLEISYVLDCVDGQLARLKSQSSPVGAHLDFLMDELKAFMLVAAVSARLFRMGHPGWPWSRHDHFWLYEGLLALGAVASAISLTTFVRRPEYAAATGRAADRGAGDYGEGFQPAEAAATAPSPLRRAIRAAEDAGRFLIHYPSYLVYVAIANRIDLFLHAYLLVNAAYAARSLLGVARALGGRRSP